MSAAVALQVAVVVSGVVQTLSEAQDALTGTDLRPAIHRAADVLEMALQSVEAQKVNGHARPAPEPLTAPEEPEESHVRLRRPAPPRLTAEQTEQELERLSEWDPEGPMDQMEVSRCRALLLEVVRRAAHDWVLYRQHDRLELKQRAQLAYTWLFEESPGHHWWRTRQEEGRMITAFLVICDELDLDPETVRRRVRGMDVKSILSAGRPAERRRRRDRTDEMHHDEYGVAIDFDVVGADDNPMRSSYENHFAVATSAYL